MPDQPPLPATLPTPSLPEATGFQILTEIACTINSVLDLEQLYGVIYEQCSRIFDTRNFWIGRSADGRTAYAVLRFFAGERIVPLGETVPVEAGLNTEVLRTRRTLCVDDYVAARAERGLPPDPRMRHGEQASWLGVPMLVGDQLIGIIVNSREHPFTAVEARFMEAVAALCAVAIENAGLIQLVSETAQDLLRRTKELSDLNNVARAVNRSLDLPTVLAQGADMLLRATGWDWATVCLQTPGGGWEVAMHRDAGRPAGATAGQLGDINDPDGPFYPFIIRALMTGRPVVVDTARDDFPEVAALQRHLHDDARRLVVFPLRAGSAGTGAEPPVVGLLLLASRAVGDERATAAMLGDATLLAIGDQLASAVQNARLLGDVQTARSHLAAVLEASTDGIVFYDTALRVELANRAVHALFGVPPGSLLGLPVEDVAERLAPSFADPIGARAVIAGMRARDPEDAYEEQCTLRNPLRVYQRLVRPVHDSSGAPLGRLLVYHDITEATDLERRTRELAAINAVATVLNRSLDLTTMLDRAAGAVLDVTRWDTVAVRLWNPLTSRWDLFIRRAAQSERPQQRPVADGPLGNWIEDGDAAVYQPITPDLLAGRPQTFRTGRAGAGRTEPPETRVALPIRVRTQTLGMLELGTAGTIPADEVAAQMADPTLRGICEQLGLAVENARLFAEARQVAALEERQHLARELHDSVTQSLFTVTLMAEAAQAMVGRDATRVGPYLDRLKSTAASALDEMRALLAQLRPTTLGASGLGAALRRHAETVAQQIGLVIEVEVHPDLRGLPTPLEDALFRITQEALHNTVKHAAAGHAWVRLAGTTPPGGAEPILVLTVEDDGCGFDPAHAAEPGRGLGLTSMRERAAALGGHLTIDSVAGRGTRVVVAVPLAEVAGTPVSV